MAFIYKIICNKPYKSTIFYNQFLSLRYVGEKEKFQYAISKLNLYAYENDIALTGETYIILMLTENEQGNKDGFIDVFMPIKKNAN